MNPHILLAKQAVETYIKEEKIIEPPKDLPKEFFERRTGTFVTIEKSDKRLSKNDLRFARSDKQLRGCIGTYLPTRINIAEEIIHNAVAAATKDYRFGPIREEELSQLFYTVYILSEPELVKDVKDIKDPIKFSEEKFRRAGLDPKKFGIIVKTAPFTYPNEDVVFNGHMPYKSGLLLPGLEEVDTIEEQILIACRKAGIDPIKEKILIYKFTVEKFQ